MVKRAWGPLGAALAATACAHRPPPAPEPRPVLGVEQPLSTPDGTPVTQPGSGEVRATILPGNGVRATPATKARLTVSPPSGDVNLNFPAVPVGEVAKAIGGILGIPVDSAPGLSSPVTLVTPRPVARAAVLPLFEQSLANAGLALVPQGEGFRVLPADQARSAAPPAGAGQTFGYGREVIRLQFVSADQLKRLIDPILPGVIAGTDPAQNAIIVTGAAGQRESVRDLMRQFDVNWLRGVSFGLFVPRKTDARLIAPELEKLLNAPDAPTRGLVRLIAMERLNGILAISGQAQYLDDVRRWVEVLDREGESAEPRLFVYRVQNGRAADLAAVISTAFNGGGTVGPGGARSPGQPGGFGVTGGGAFGAGPGGASSPGFGFGGRITSGGQQPGYLLGETPTGPIAGSGGVPTLGGFAGNGVAAGASVGGLNAVPSQNRLSTAAPGLQAQGQGGTALGATITADETNNAILVFGTPRTYAIIESALRQLDTPPAQVLIEASVSEVTLTDQLRYGLQTIFKTNTGDVTLSENTGSGGGVTSSGPPFTALSQITRVFPGFSYLYTNGDISAVLNALEGLTKVNVLSSPKLMVINNQTASLQVGNQVPVVSASATSTLTTVGGAITNQIDYRDTGVILKITPRVNAGGLVLLDIAQEVSDVTQGAGTLAQSTSPTFSTRRIATSIAVQDGQTIALGGLISDNRQRGRSGIPFLSRIPIIGGVLFGSTNDRTTRQEILILLRPRVVRSQSDGRAVTQELLDKIRTVRGLLPDVQPEGTPPLTPRRK
ncbi:MAG: type II secretion system secretin GspD [Sphingomonadaceae bacterium]|nr:type II secretion system secretin GspD [Sphingomonadaceae bacterium]